MDDNRKQISPFNNEAFFAEFPMEKFKTSVKTASSETLEIIGDTLYHHQKCPNCSKEVSEENKAKIPEMLKVINAELDLREAGDIEALMEILALMPSQSDPMNVN